MNVGIALSALFVGYLSGSVSFAVLIMRLAAPESRPSKIRITVPGSDLEFESDSISATTVRLQIGARYGGLVTLLDMAKAAVPALVYRYLYPDSSYYLIAAGMATVGHIWPLFHRFHGGRGLSCIVGGMFVVDWIGLLITSLIGGALGIWRKNMLLVTGAGNLLMIPWLWIRTQDTDLILYAILMNGLYWAVMIPEVRQYMAIISFGGIESFQDATQLNVIGEDGTERIDTITVSAIRNKIASWFGKGQSPDEAVSDREA